MEKIRKCVSCGKDITNIKGSVIMECPNCGKHEVIRCFYCRRAGAKYSCPECEFKGPN